MSAYLLCDNQPAINIAIVFSEPTAMRNSTPTFRSASTLRSPNGITAKTTIVGTNTTIGASQNSIRSASRVVIGSLNRSFSASATGCSSPAGPTRFGPIRFCISPTTRRSIQMNARTLSTVQSSTPTIPITLEVTYGTQSGAPQSRIRSSSAPTALPIWRRAAVAHDVEAKLTAWRLNASVRFADRRPDRQRCDRVSDRLHGRGRENRVDRPLRYHFERLLQDADTLSHLRQTHDEPVVNVAFSPHCDVEINLIVRSVGVGLADV